MTLDVFSSFSLYGWASRDEEYKELFEFCKNHPKINYHGAVPNATIRDELAQKHIFAYPSIWEETSCLSLMEAMSAGLVCVHSNLGALYETGANFTRMYQYQEDKQRHMNLFYSVLKATIEDLETCSQAEYRSRIMVQKSYADVFYNWKNRVPQWEAVLQAVLMEPLELPKHKGPVFSYQVR